MRIDYQKMDKHPNLFDFKSTLTFRLYFTFTVKYFELNISSIACYLPAHWREVSPRLYFWQEYSLGIQSPEWESNNSNYRRPFAACIALVVKSTKHGQSKVES